MENFIEIQSHDMALMWSRFERIAAIMACIFIITAFEIGFSFITKVPPSWIATGIATIVGQLMVLKCWMDMAIKRQPDKNCWEFERK
jgi:hypothetical protein